MRMPTTTTIPRRSNFVCVALGRIQVGIVDGGARLGGAFLLLISGDAAAVGKHVQGDEHRRRGLPGSAQPPWHLFPRVVGWDVLVDGVPPAPDEEKGGQVRDCRSELEWSFQVMSCLGNISL